MQQPIDVSLRRVRGAGTLAGSTDSEEQGDPSRDRTSSALAHSFNLSFAAPLATDYVSGIANSISKWTSTHFTEEFFIHYVSLTHSSEIQARRGTLSGQQSIVGGRPGLGKSWLEMGISISTILG